LTGTARVTGSLVDPRATFALQAASFNMRPLSTFGAGPLQIEAQGSYAGETVTLGSLRATGPSGLTVSASGQLPLSGAGLNIDARGSVPLSLANRLFADRGAQVTGTLNANVGIRGRLSNPAISGSF